MASKEKTKKTVVTLTHDEASRKNIPTAEYQPVLEKEQLSPIPLAYERGVAGLDEEKQRRNRDLDPQLVWRGKDEQDWSDLVVNAPPLYIQEKVHPKALIDDLLRRAETNGKAERQIDLFADFNGLPNESARTEFYQHDANWSNRMILGDSLQVMASLAEREGLRGEVQCIYIDPPYGIQFNSNFQWSTTSRDVIDGRVDHITREPEQVRAFRDTWRFGIHSYLTYLRDRLTVARDLLRDSGAIFVQIGDQNVHRVRALLDEVFGSDNFVTEIVAKKKGSQISGTLDPVNDFILCYGKQPKASNALKFRPLFLTREDEEIFDDFPFVELDTGERLPVSALEERDDKKYRADYSSFKERYPTARLFALHPLKSGGFRKNQSHDFCFQNRVFPIGEGQCWKHTVVEEDSNKIPGMTRLARAGRLFPLNRDVRFIRYSPSPSIKRLSNWWDNLGGASSPIYVVQTNTELIKRCLLLCSDPGDLVLDPTCGSGTTAYVAEQWGRRWIVIDTSRVALALARARIMGAKYPYYLLADTPEGRSKEADISGRIPSAAESHGSIRQGFVLHRARWNTSGSIANNVEIDVIWEKAQSTLESLRERLNKTIGQHWSEWEVPRDADKNWTDEARSLHAEWWKHRMDRQRQIDASISAKAEPEYLHDKPYEDNRKVRVAGPFTVESLSPHRTLAVDENDELIDWQAKSGEAKDFAEVILENLKTSGVQQAHKEDKISFSSIAPWPGYFVCAEGRYTEGDKEKRAAIFIGPEFGTVSRPDLVEAAREAGDAGFDVLIACAFNYDAHSSEFNKLGRIQVLKARMNADLHMAEDLKNTGKGNLFVIFGEPDIEILNAKDGQIQVKIRGVDVFHPNTGKVRSDGAEGIACWFIDTDYNEESFFVRHAYFLGANDPYKSLKTTLRAEINEDAWATLNSDTSRPFDRPKSQRVAVKVINHLGDEVMKVFHVD